MNVQMTVLDFEEMNNGIVHLVAVADEADGVEPACRLLDMRGRGLPAVVAGQKISVDLTVLPVTP